MVAVAAGLGGNAIDDAKNTFSDYTDDGDLETQVTLGSCKSTVKFHRLDLDSRTPGEG